MNTRSAVMSAAFCLIVFLSYGQTAYQLKSYKVSVNGTSTLHDWSSEVTTVNWSGLLKAEGGQLKSVKSAEITIPVTSIKSKEGNIMDKKTYEAFTSDKNPTIVFTLTKATVAGTRIDATGSLTMAGTTKPITMTLEGEVMSGGEVQISGSQKVNMKNFNMTPPKAVMGTIKVGPDVTVLFELVLAPQ